MSDEQVPEDAIIRALSGLDARVLPTDLERARARRHLDAVIAAEFSGRASSDTSVPDVQPDQVEWMPLGVFGLTQDDTGSGDDTGGNAKAHRGLCALGHASSAEVLAFVFVMPGTGARAA